MTAPTTHKRARLETTANYQPTSILITGGAGFIASHVVILLVEKYPQYKVRARRAVGSLPWPPGILPCPRARSPCATALNVTPPVLARLAPDRLP